jgi:SAM-dependent methyltransferase
VAGIEHDQEHSESRASGFEGGFDTTQFKALAEAEGESFWFRARNRVVLWALATWFADARSLLEVGCGTGYVLQAISEAFTELELNAVDLHAEGLAYARRRVPRAQFAQADARALPFRDRFDVVGAFDVVEHVADDVSVLASLRDAARPGGGVLLTVPQHAFLWSDFDDASHHIRRYGRGELEAKARIVGLDVIASTSFIALLLPLMVGSRLLPRGNRPRSIAGELRNPRPIEAVLRAVSDVELALLKQNVRFGFGGSRLVVARRPIIAG